MKTKELMASLAADLAAQGYKATASWDAQHGKFVLSVESELTGRDGKPIVQPVLAVIRRTDCWQVEQWHAGNEVTTHPHRNDGPPEKCDTPGKLAALCREVLASVAMRNLLAGLNG